MQITPSIRSALSYPKFTAAAPRVLYLQPEYFCAKDVVWGLQKAGLEVRVLPVPTHGLAPAGHFRNWLVALAEFRPDFVLCLNMMGLDTGGEMTGACRQLEMPLASWFVDSPLTVLWGPGAADLSGVACFTWDRGSIPLMRTFGFRDVFHLPLAGNPDVFPHAASAPALDVGAVWNSNREQIERFQGLVENASPAEKPRLQAALDIFRRTQGYRASLLRALPGVPATLAGDEYWKQMNLPVNVTCCPGLPYGPALADFYRAHAVNLNATSCQMATALNQRVYDVPLAGGFLLTDAQEEMFELFEKDQTAVFRSPQELSSLVRHYLDHPEERARTSAAAREHILKRHLYTHRVRKMVEYLKNAH